ncbi:MAG TPA: hypothetical protein VGG99_17155 [Acetobacteraceae bacterium]
MAVVVLAALSLGGAMRARAQPADCANVPAAGPPMDLSIDLAGRPGVPAGVNGKARIAVPMQTPGSDCGEPSAPSDVLHGEPGDLLRGTGPPPGSMR